MVNVSFSLPLVSESYIVHDVNERLAHGRQLKIYLPKSAHKLEFTPANNPSGTRVYWEEKKFVSDKMKKGRVSGTGSDRRWYIDKVTRLWMKERDHSTSHGIRVLVLVSSLASFACFLRLLPSCICLSSVADRLPSEHTRSRTLLKYYVHVSVSGDLRGRGDLHPKRLLE